MLSSIDGHRFSSRPEIISRLKLVFMLGVGC
jgi:hypothetical protein